MPVQFDLKKPWAEQLEFFRKKLAMPSAAWDEFIGAMHDVAFVVAGAMAADLLADMLDAVDTVIEKGQGIGWFRQNFDSIVAKYGWEYKGEKNWRTRIIYQTNLLTSHHAGRYAQLMDPDLLSIKPFWTYRHGHPITPRETHLSWDGITLPANHEWFQVHFTPNGWGCTCYIIATSKEEAERKKYRIMEEPPDDGTYQYVVPSTGEIVTLPVGVDYGWNYAPGASLAQSLKTKVDEAMKSLPPEIAQALSEEVGGLLE